MKYIVIGVIAIFCLVVYSVQPGDYSDTSYFANHKEQTCVNTSPDWNKPDIKLEYSVDIGEAIGQWDSQTQTIKLVPFEGTDIDTIAHEVSHAVDTIMRKKFVIDSHYEAWLQGALTVCVYDLVKKDLASM